MSTILDTVFSALIGGLILVSLHGLNAKLANAASTKLVATNVQQNIASLTEVIEHDLRKAGYNNFSAPNFKAADSTNLYIRADFNHDGNPDSLRYYLGTTADASQIDPRARVLYRSYNAGPAVAMQMGVTRFRLWYYDAAGNPLATTPGVANPALIRSVKLTIAMTVGSTIETFRKPNGTVVRDTTFTSSSWEKILRPVNLK